MNNFALKIYEKKKFCLISQKYFCNIFLMVLIYSLGGNFLAETYAINLF